MDNAALGFLEKLVHQKIIVDVGGAEPIEGILKAVYPESLILGKSEVPGGQIIVFVAHVRSAAPAFKRAMGDVGIA